MRTADYGLWRHTRWIERFFSNGSVRLNNTAITSTTTILHMLKPSNRKERTEQKKKAKNWMKMKCDACVCTYVHKKESRDVPSYMNMIWTDACVAISYIVTNPTRFLPHDFFFFFLILLKYSLNISFSLV